MITLKVYSSEAIYFEKDSKGSSYYQVDHKQMKRFTPTQTVTTPIGSLWKLFVYTYLREQKIEAPEYQCKGILQEEAFCCEKNQKIGMDQALAKSCGLFFAQDRLHISAYDWKKFWSKHVKETWLTELDQLQPQTMVAVEDLMKGLQALRKMSSASYLEVVLRQVVVDGTAHDGFSALGSMARIKTFTWNEGNNQKKLIGGFAGWLSDGALVWMMAPGKSYEVLQRFSSALENRWNKHPMKLENECVQVNYFSDYALDKIIKSASGQEIRGGSLQGHFDLFFKNGNKLHIESNEDLQVIENREQQLNIQGKMNLTDYVARVIDREFNPKVISGAEAMAVVVRTYLYQNAKKIGGCYQVSDTTKFQRVSPHIPSLQAKRISLKTMGLILEGVPNIRYHQNKTVENGIAWESTKVSSDAGKDFLFILKNQFPQAKVILHTEKSEAACQPLMNAHRWLHSQLPRWNRLLLQRVGFEKPKQVKVCLSKFGTPFSKTETEEIFIEHFNETEDQVSLAHEYLHLAFRHHPLGGDEKMIDDLAKEIVIR